MLIFSTNLRYLLLFAKDIAESLTLLGNAQIIIITF